ncbi:MULTISPECIES: DUF4224 domain-containing protein [unclassified Methylophilus]|uniref:DUF4224 domain-containing protein n=1 Tax=unclassified Methylophilus TaxID=2630143 RepID=UPI0003630664|nr:MULTISPECIES: DUF4224 domain-containing protein [unclassified Methylophilus]
MRISLEELINITGKKTPKTQADWFKSHFDVDAVYDSLGVIITHDVFNAIVAKRYGVLTAKDEKVAEPRPQLIPPKTKKKVEQEDQGLDYDEIIKLVQNTQPQPPHYNLTDAAKKLGISYPTLKKYILEGKIKLNAINFVSAAEIYKFLENKDS